MPSDNLPPPNSYRDVFFGKTHVRTSWSLGAYVMGNTVTGPEEAYRDAMGEPVKHPAGYEVQWSRPLDFQGVVADAFELRDFQQMLASRF